MHTKKWQTWVIGTSQEHRLCGAFQHSFCFIKSATLPHTRYINAYTLVLLPYWWCVCVHLVSTCHVQSFETGALSYGFICSHTFAGYFYGHSVHKNSLKYIIEKKKYEYLISYLVKEESLETTESIEKNKYKERESVGKWSRKNTCVF